MITTVVIAVARIGSLWVKANRTRKILQTVSHVATAVSILNSINKKSVKHENERNQFHSIPTGGHKED